ncbi:hypothetical protein G7046_g4865 [Stylonectria norvegica]|nr:hypothetical protein G7046_g4865 [Stylonectria norvegica]
MPMRAPQNPLRSDLVAQTMTSGPGTRVSSEMPREPTRLGAPSRSPERGSRRRAISTGSPLGVERWSTCITRLTHTDPTPWALLAFRLGTWLLVGALPVRRPSGEGTRLADKGWRVLELIPRGKQRLTILESRLMQQFDRSGPEAELSRPEPGQQDLILVQQLRLGSLH